MKKRGFGKGVVFFMLLIFFAVIYYLFKKFAVVYLINILPVEYTKNLENLLIFIAIVVLNYFFVGLSSNILKGYLESRGDKRDIKLFVSVYKYFMWFFVIFITLSALFKQIGSLITSIGLIGFGITLALQKPILNFVGWLNIIFGKTYKIGDIVQINNINGQVYDVTVMQTYLSELNIDGDHTGKSVSVPNEFVLTSAITNYTKGSSYMRDEINIYLTYKSNLRKAVKIVEKITKEVSNRYMGGNLPKTIKPGYEKPVSRLSIYDKGARIKIRYFVDFNIGNDIKTELSSKILEELNKHKDISLGKTESIV